jgi:hypothetical protein
MGERGWNPSTRAKLGTGQVGLGPFVLLRPVVNLWGLVCLEGIEPSTSVLSGQRSTTELQTQILLPGSGQRSTTELHAQNLQKLYQE